MSDPFAGALWHLVENVADNATLCCGRPVSELPAIDGLTEDSVTATCRAGSHD